MNDTTIIEARDVKQVSPSPNTNQNTAVELLIQQNSVLMGQMVILQQQMAQQYELPLRAALARKRLRVIGQVPAIGKDLLVQFRTGPEYTTTDTNVVKDVLKSLLDATTEFPIKQTLPNTPLSLNRMAASYTRCRYSLLLWMLTQVTRKSSPEIGKEFGSALSTRVMPQQSQTGLGSSLSATLTSVALTAPKNLLMMGMVIPYLSRKENPQEELINAIR